MKKDKIFEELQKHGETLVRIETNLTNHLHHHEMHENKNKWIMTAVLSIVLSLVTVGVNVFLKYNVR